MLNAELALIDETGQRVNAGSDRMRTWIGFASDDAAKHDASKKIRSTSLTDRQNTGSALNTRFDVFVVLRNPSSKFSEKSCRGEDREKDVAPGRVTGTAAIGGTEGADQLGARARLRMLLAHCACRPGGAA